MVEITSLAQSYLDKIQIIYIDFLKNAFCVSHNFSGLSINHDLHKAMIHLSIDTNLSFWST